jgi:Legume lectin domain
MKKLILLLGWIFFALPAAAATSNIYITQNGTPGGTGASCTNALSAGWFNTPANWGTGGQIGPGTTVHLCGTFTGTAGSTMLTAHGSGASGNPITILFEPGAILTAPYWYWGGAIVLSGQSWIVVNGDINNGRQGIIQNTDNGSHRTYQQQSRLIYSDGCSNCTIENITLADGYVKLPDVAITSITGNGTTATVTCASACNNSVNHLVAIVGNSVGGFNTPPNTTITIASTPDSTHFTFASTTSGTGTGGTLVDDGLAQMGVNGSFIGYNVSPNFTINNVLAHDVGWAFNGWAQNYTVKNSEVYNADHGIAFGITASVGGLAIYGNHFHDFANWDTVNDAYHHDYIHLWDHTVGTSVTDGVIYNNTFDGVFGNCCTTGNIFLQGGIDNVAIFNNTFIDSTTDTVGRTGVWMGGEVVTVNGAQQTITQSNNSLLNNYFSMGAHRQGAAIYSSGYETGLAVENNILIGGQADISLVGGTTISVVDHNVYDDLSTDYGDGNTFHWNSSPATGSFTSWKSSSECNCDPNSVFATNSAIKVNSGGMPQPGSPAIGAGANLSSKATGALAPLAFDKNGVARPATGNWDIGAFQAQGATVIDFGNGFSSTGMAFNGSAALSGTHLRVTNGGQTQAGSGWFTTLVNVQNFTTDFTFQLINPNADGMTFAIQNSSLGALGACGGGLGYGTDSCSSQPGIPSSVAVKFDLFSNHTEGNNSTGIYTDGADPTIPATTLGNGVNLHSGDVFKVHIAYDGTTLTMTITDTVTNATFTTSWAVNIPSTVGANTAYVGFTGGTGGQTATQDIITWTYNN